MMLTQKKADTLSDFLNADESRAKKLLSMTANEALKEINAEGYDFTADELKEYGALLKDSQNQKDGELCVDALDNISGGRVPKFKGSDITITIIIYNTINLW